jgi:hypothetical protein
VANPEIEETVANPENEETVANEPAGKSFNWIEGPDSYFWKLADLPKWWQGWIETKRRDAEDLVAETVRFSEKKAEQLNAEVLKLQTELLELWDIIGNENLAKNNSPRVKKNVSEGSFFMELVLTATTAIAAIVIISLAFCFIVFCMQKKICCFAPQQLAPAATTAPASVPTATETSAQATTAAPATATSAPAPTPATATAPASMPAAATAPATALATTPSWDPKFFLEAGIELESLRREKIPAAPQPNPFGHFQSPMHFNPFVPVHPSFYQEQRRHRRHQHSSEDEEALELEHKPRSTRKKS